MIDLYDEPRAKLFRATKHFNELVSEEAAFNASNPVSVHVDPDYHGRPAILLTANSFPTLAAYAVAGDVINNLRAALDLTISAACRLNGKTNLSNTYFPFASIEGDFENTTTGKYSRMKAANHAIKSLAKAFRPWKDGNSTLYAISKLATLDKHRALLALSVHQGGVELDGLQIKGPNGLSRINGNAHIRLSRENPTDVLFETDPGSVFSLSGPCHVKVIFAFEAVDRQPYLGATKMLGDMIRVTTEIVETFASASREGKLT